MAGNRTVVLPQGSSKCGCELNVTDRRMGTCVGSADGQLARGITGGRTERRSRGRVPPMLGVRPLLVWPRPRLFRSGGVPENSLTKESSV